MAGRGRKAVNYPTCFVEAVVQRSCCNRFPTISSPVTMLKNMSFCSLQFLLHHCHAREYAIMFSIIISLSLPTSSKLCCRFLHHSFVTHLLLPTISLLLLLQPLPLRPDNSRDFILNAPLLWLPAQQLLQPQRLTSRVPPPAQTLKASHRLCFFLIHLLCRSFRDILQIRRGLRHPL